MGFGSLLGVKKKDENRKSQKKKNFRTPPVNRYQKMKALEQSGNQFDENFSAVFDLDTTSANFGLAEPSSSLIIPPTDFDLDPQQISDIDSSVVQNELSMFETEPSNLQFANHQPPSLSSRFDNYEPTSLFAYGNHQPPTSRQQFDFQGNSAAAFGDDYDDDFQYEESCQDESEASSPSDSELSESDFEFPSDDEFEDAIDQLDDRSDQEYLPFSFQQKSEKVSSEFAIFDVNLLMAALSTLLICSNCNVPLELHRFSNTLTGLFAKYAFKCPRCSEAKEFYNSSKNKNGVEEINLRLFYAMRCNGNGLSATKTFCTMMNMAAVIHKFQKVQNALLEILSHSAKMSMEAAARTATKEGVGSLISVDGSWMKRGYHSLMGVVTAMNPKTNQVIDVFPMSKYCQVCKMDVNKQRQPGSACTCNFDPQASSGSMEVFGATEIFKRSRESRGLEYKKYLGDGDSKAYNAACALGLYPIEKLECINHFAKRFKRRCEEFIKKSKRKINGRGGVTANMIVKLQSYYRRAIINNCHDLTAMKNSIWATFYHYTSTDQNPQHHYCPTDSWCVFNRSDKPRDFSHATHIHKCKPEIFKLLQPLYESLSNISDLQKLTHGLTTNCNESFNSLIWRRAPKSQYHSFTSLKLALYDAVICQNHTYKARETAIIYFQFEGLDGAGKHTTEGLKEMTKKAEKDSQKEKVTKRKYRTSTAPTSSTAYLSGAYN